MTQAERLKILEMLENGIITPDQAAQLLASVGEEEVDEPREYMESFEEGGVEIEVEEQTSEAVSNSNSDGAADSQDTFEEEQSAATIAETPAEGETPESPAAVQVPLPTPTSAPVSPVEAVPKQTSQLDLDKWRRWWILPLAIGVVITSLTGWFIYLGTVNAWAGFWMFCLWVPMLFGITLTALSWLSHNTPWLHVRVNTGQDEWPRRVAISFPIPIRLTAWGLRTFGHFIPNFDATGIDEVIVALGQSMIGDEPIYIEVDNEGDSGEYVEVFIG